MNGAVNWTLDIGQERRQITNANELREQLCTAHERARHEPLIALLNAPDGSTLAIGLGRDRSVLNHIAPGGWPSRHATDDFAGRELLQYTLAGQISEVPACGTVAIQNAIDACVRFMQNGDVNGSLSWEDD